MKYSFALVLALILLVLPASTHSQLPPTGYIGLFTDEDHSNWCFNGAAYYPVEMWIYCWPGVHGMICAEFKINYPSNVIQGTMTVNPEIQAITCYPSCVPEDGLSACKTACQWDWNWFYHQTLYVADAARSVVEVVEFPSAGAYQFASCEEGFPIEPCIVYSNLYFNYEPDEPECVGSAVEDTSWGAIKSLYME